MKIDNESSGAWMFVCLLVLGFALAATPAFAQHVHHIYYNNVQWNDEDLTALTNSAPPYGTSGIAAFYTTPNQQFHIYYVDTNQHVRQLYFNNKSWSGEDLTAETGGMTADLGTEVSGFAIGNLQHVFFLGNDRHVHQLYYNNAFWSDQDITSVAGGPLTGVRSLLAFATKPNNQFHVYYQAQSNSNQHDVHQLYFNGTNWRDENLSAIAGTVGNDGWTAGFAVGNLQHVFLQGYDTFGNIVLDHLYYNNSTWVNENVTQAVNGVPLPFYTGIAAFQVPGSNQLETYTMTSDGDIHQYSFKNNLWADLDLTATLGGNTPAEEPSVQFTACATTPNKQFHFFYEDLFLANVNQFYFNGTKWFSEDNGGGPTTGNGGMASFAIGNFQHVFYYAY